MSDLEYAVRQRIDLWLTLAEQAADGRYDLSANNDALDMVTELLFSATPLATLFKVLPQTEESPQLPAPPPPRPTLHLTEGENARFAESEEDVERFMGGFCEGFYQPERPDRDEEGR
jgi:hypothetical protein